MGSDPVESAPAAPVSRRQLREVERARQAALAAAAGAPAAPASPTRVPRGGDPAPSATWAAPAPVATLAVPRGATADVTRVASRATSPETTRVLHRGPGTAGDPRVAHPGPAAPARGAGGTSSPWGGPREHTDAARRTAVGGDHPVDGTPVAPRVAAPEGPRVAPWGSAVDETHVGRRASAPADAPVSRRARSARPAPEPALADGDDHTRVVPRATGADRAPDPARTSGTDRAPVASGGAGAGETRVVPRTPGAAEGRVVRGAGVDRDAGAADETRVVPRVADADTTHVIPATPGVDDDATAVRSEEHVADRPVSRRATRSSAQAAPRVRRSAGSAPAPGIAHGPRGGRWAARTSVLAALIGVTVVVPVVENALPGGGDFGDPAIAEAADLPDTVEALTASSASGLPPASLVSAEASLVRAELSASRGEERDPLPGCDGATRAAGANGLLATADLCTLWEGKTQLRADAAVSLAVLNQAFIARFGVDMCLSSGYRTLAQQRSVKAQKGGLAAAPGKSNHGWGLAVDLCSSETTGAKWTWLNENAPSFGWDNPAWARPGGSGPYERWHWEYTKGVQEDGEFYG